MRHCIEQPHICTRIELQMLFRNRRHPYCPGIGDNEGRTFANRALHFHSNNRMRFTRIAANHKQKISIAYLAN